MTYSTSGTRQKFPHTKTTDTSVFNRSSQVGLSAPPKPDTPGRKHEPPRPSSRLGQQELRVSRVSKEGEARWYAHSPSCVGRVAQQPASGVTSVPARSPSPGRGPEIGRWRPLTQGRAELPATVLAQQKLLLPAPLAASAGAPPARLPGPRADARGGDSGAPPRKGPERLCRCPAWRPSPTPRPSADGTRAWSAPGGQSQGRGSGRPGALPAAAPWPLRLALSGGRRRPSACQRRARGPPVTPAPLPPRPPAPPPPGGAA